jgi:hypothetical protein
MQQTVTFFLEQAAICGKAAEETVLPLQRERFLRSQAAWQKLADQRGETLAERRRIDSEKAERVI